MTRYIIVAAALLLTHGCSSGESSPITAVSQSAIVVPANNITPSAAVGAVAGQASVTQHGAARYEVPIAVPPGIRGMEPQVALTYTHGSGNGAVGVGWRIATSSTIRRCPRKVGRDGYSAPVQFDDSDIVCLDGERLVLTDGSNLQDGANYLKRHNDWTHVELIGVEQESPWFRVTTDDHRILHYGEAFSSRRQYEGVTYEWMLSSVQDRFGNRIEYDYTRFDTNYLSVEGNLANATTVARLSEIRYTYSTRDDGTMVPATRFVKFFYTNRPDMFKGFYYGALRAEFERLDRIETHDPDGLVKEYRLTYDTSPTTGHSRVTELVECDALGVCLDPTTFSWHDGGGGFDDVAAPAEDPVPGVYASDLAASVFADINGNGRHELLFASSTEAPGADSGTMQTTWSMWTSWEDFPEDSVIPTGMDAVLPVAGPSVSELVISPTVAIGELNYQFPRPAVAGNFDGLRGDDVYVPKDSSLTILRQAPATTELGALDAEGFVLPADFVADFDGDGYTDVVGCDEDGTFHFSFNRPGPGDTRTFVTIEKDIDALSCSDYASYLVFDVDGDGAAELLVSPADNQEAGAMGNRSGYYTIDRIAGPCGGGGCIDSDFTVTQSSLPFDTFQRWRDETCQSAYTSLPAFNGLTRYRFGAGLGNDKIADFNGDGLADVLRFNVVLNADQTILEAIEARFNFWEIDPDVQQYPNGGWLANKCEASEPDRIYGIELFINTGDGFREGQFIWTDTGDPHRGYWQQFVPAQVVDYDANGRSDLIIPYPTAAWPASLDGEEEWKLLSNIDSGVASVVDINLHWDTTGTIDPDETWLENLLGYDRPNRRVGSRAVSGPDVNGDGRGDLLFMAAADTGNWDHNLDIHIRDSGPPDYIDTITDGLGHWTTFEYTLTHDPTVIAGSARVPRGRMIVRAMLSDAGPVGEGHNGSVFVYNDNWVDVVEYEYFDPVLSPSTRGFIGYERTRVTRSVRDGYDPQQFDLTDHWLSVTENQFDLAYDATVDAHPLSGRPIATTTTRQVDRDGTPYVLVDLTETEYETNTSQVSSPVLSADPPIYSVRSTSVTTSSFDVAADTCAGVAPMSLDGSGDEITACQPAELAGITPVIEATTTFGWDDYDNLTDRTKALGNGLTDTVHVVIYDQGGDPWWIPRLPRTITSTSTANDGSSRTQGYKFTYDFSVGMPIAIVRSPNEPLYQHTASIVYSAQGNVLEKTLGTPDGVTRTVLQTWDNDGYFLTGTSVPGAVGLEIERYTHTGLGVVTHQKGPHGVVLEATYDGFGRPTGAMRKSDYLNPSDGSDSYITYLPGSDFPGASYRVRTGSNGSGSTTTDHDRLGRVLRMQWAGFSDGNDNMGVDGDIFVVTQYDPRGLVRRMFGPYRDAEPLSDMLTIYTHDGAGRVIDVHRMDASHRTFSYAGGTTVQTDADGRFSIAQLDAGGMVTKTTDHNGVELCLDRGVFGKVVTIRRNCGNVPGEPTPDPSIMWYDDYGRLVNSFTPEGGWQIREYNALDEVIGGIDAKGQVSTRHYDPTGRLDYVEYEDGNALYLYHAITGRLHQTVSVDGVVSRFDYDGFGRPDEMMTWLDGDTFVLEYTYDGNGRLQELHYPDSVGLPFSVQFSYDPYGYMHHIQNNSGELLWRADRATSDGQLTREFFGGTVPAPQLTTTRRYHPVTRQLEEVSTSQGTSNLMRELYHWTPGGDLAWKEDAKTGIREDYTYDALHRLTQATVTDGPAVTVSTVDYNALGDITFKTDVGSYVYDPDTRRPDSIGGLPSVYDPNGNLVSRDGNDYVYSPRNRIRTLTQDDGVVVDYLYDAAQRRVSRSDSDGNETVYIGEGLYERTTRPDGSIDHRYRVHAWGRPVAELSRLDVGGIVTPSTRYIHTDYRGSAALITDSAGALPHRAAFDPWGQAVDPDDWVSPVTPGPTAGVNVGFTGHESMVDGGLMNMRGRMFDPQTAQFNRPDPIIQAFGDLRSHNRYSYVWNRPTALIDPSGFMGEPADGGDGSSQGSGEPSAPPGPPPPPPDDSGDWEPWTWNGSAWNTSRHDGGDAPGEAPTGEPAYGEIDPITADRGFDAYRERLSEPDDVMMPEPTEQLGFVAFFTDMFTGNFTDRPPITPPGAQQGEATDDILPKSAMPQMAEGATQAWLILMSNAKWPSGRTGIFSPKVPKIRFRVCSGGQCVAHSTRALGRLFGLTDKILKRLPAHNTARTFGTVADASASARQWLVHQLGDLGLKVTLNPHPNLIAAGRYVVVFPKAAARAGVSNGHMVIVEIASGELTLFNNGARFTGAEASSSFMRMQEIYGTPSIFQATVSP